MTNQELRIGNYVLTGVGEEKIYEIYTHKVLVGNDMSASTVKYFEIDPIPLSEEWLLKLGFQSNPYEDRYELGDIDVECDKTKGFTDLWLAGHPHIKYVHQLQNLYWCLCGEELTTNQ